MTEMDLTPGSIVEGLLARFPGTVAVEAWGETSLFYNPGRVLARGVYFATVKRKDGENDRASQLDRDGVFRFNLGVPQPLFVERFGPPLARPGKGEAIDGPWDFTQLDQITPHPVYGWMGWVSVLNPSGGTMTDLDGLIDAAFDKAKKAFGKRTVKG
jgi:hypothetical protein